ncbi:alpha,alpha-trehalase TreF [Ferruginibacter sp. SUN106]|uniref:alpha,alpha-trehalase TreF n=1 Tax=Ferruginibacter sp. SUN106 TaxID=2978348 RepID=UPI003D36944E
MTEQNLFFIESLGTLYEDVQSSGIFADSKFFVDCAPKYAPTEIVTKYNSSKNDAAFKLEIFIKANFDLPAETVSTYSSAKKTIDAHLNDLWDELKRMPAQSKGTLIPLPYQYIVPGGRFREIYYWDSYFTMLGLQMSGRIDIIENMVDNFAYLINEFGFIPNGNRTYYLSRSQPPFFAMMVNLLAEEKGDDVLLKYHPVLEKEYAFWMNGADTLDKANTACNHVVLLADEGILNRYWDSKDTPRPEAFAEDMHLAAIAPGKPEDTYRHIRAAAASGWDFSSRWFKDGMNMKTIQTTNLIPVDLNCLLAHTEATLMKMYALQHNEQAEAAMLNNINRRLKALNNCCWNETAGCYFDYNFIDLQQVEHYNLATMFPLFFGVAAQWKAEKIAFLISEKFLCNGGVVTTLDTTGQQWDAPNGWAPLQWITYKGLKEYGFNDLAKTVKQNWLANCERVFTETGKMMEKYNVMDTTITAGGGEYPNQDGFGWTNGVYLKMKYESTHIPQL